MIENRYHRMATNVRDWRKPHAGRLGAGADYVGTTGFGHEDWNFAGDIWDDGRHHLYLKQSPSSKDVGKAFNIVLGAYTSGVHVVVGFALEAVFQTASLSDQIWARRARELFELEQLQGLGGIYDGLDVGQIEVELRRVSGIYNVSVHPSDLIQLPAPLIIPQTIFDVPTPMYRLLKMSDEQFKQVRHFANTEGTGESGIQDTFAEGGLVERAHKSRERNSTLVRKAKQRFLARHGCLFCEACGVVPSQEFPGDIGTDQIIEAHHDVHLSSKAHSGTTSISDLRMLCPNCHRAIHTIRPWLLVDEFKEKYWG